MTATLRPETIEYLKGIGLTTQVGRGRRKNRPMGRARIFLKDMDVGDVHMPANIGGDASRPRRKVKPVGAPTVRDLFAKDWTEFDQNRGTSPRQSGGRPLRPISQGTQNRLAYEAGVNGAANGAIAGGLAGIAARQGANLAGQAMQRAAAPSHTAASAEYAARAKKAEDLASRPGTKGEGAAAAAAAERLRAKAAAAGGRAARPGLGTAGKLLMAAGKRAPLLGAAGLGAYGAYRAAQYVRANTLVAKDWTQFDQERGAGEKTGRVAGFGAGLYATPRVARIVGRVMISRGFKRFPALGAGAIAAYGTVRGAQAAGGYVGRKIDELGAKVFKAGGADEARDEAGRWTATQHHLDQANHHAKMARAYISAAPNLSGKKLSDAVDAADMHTTAAAFHAGEAERLHAMAPKMGHLASIVARVARSIRKDWTEWNAEHQKELEQHHADFASGKISMDEANRRIGRLAARANQVSIHEVSAKEPPPRRSPLMARAGRGAVAGAKVGAIAGGLFHGAGAGMAAGPKGALVGGALGAVHGAVAGSLVGTLGGALFGKGSIEQTMGEFKRGKLHSGSKKGPQVTDRAQAIAIALDTARREGLRT